MKPQLKAPPNKNIVIWFLSLLRNNIVFLFYVVYNGWINKYNISSKEIQKEPMLSTTDQYIEKHKARFLKSFEIEPGQDEIEIGAEKSKNIFQAFYSKEELQNILVTPNNFIEEQWKRRILFENTPRGNIVMFYDAYKQGFAYYSDTYSISYPVLNAVAMKYVLMFQCRDFFMDNQIAPKSSPLIKILLEEDIKPKNTVKKSNACDSKFKVDLKDAPFAKFKNYTKPTETDKQAVIQSEKPNDTEYTRNKFIYLGKMSNFVFIQKLAQGSPINGFSSGLLDNLKGETALQKSVLDYKTFKMLSTKE